MTKPTSLSQDVYDTLTHEEDNDNQYIQFENSFNGAIYLSQENSINGKAGDKYVISAWASVAQRFPKRIISGAFGSLQKMKRMN